MVEESNQNFVIEKIIPKVIYFAMLFSNIIFVSIYFQIIYLSLQKIDKNSIMLFVFIAAALVMAFLSHIFYQSSKDYKLKDSPSTIHPAQLTHLVICWALSEGIVIFGLIGGFLGFSLIESLSFFAVGILLHLIHPFRLNTQV